MWFAVAVVVVVVVAVAEWPTGRTKNYQTASLFGPHLQKVQCFGHFARLVAVAVAVAAAVVVVVVVVVADFGLPRALPWRRGILSKRVGQECLWEQRATWRWRLTESGLLLLKLARVEPRFFIGFVGRESRVWESVLRQLWWLTGNLGRAWGKAPVPAENKWDCTEVPEDTCKSPQNRD